MIERMWRFLADILLPHAIAEERLIYREAARVLGRPEWTATDVRCA